MTNLVDVTKALRAEEEKAYDMIEPAERDWLKKDEDAKIAAETLHDIRQRLYRISRAIRVLEGKDLL